jgi:hypothetical protein
LTLDRTNWKCGDTNIAILYDLWISYFHQHISKNLIFQ